MPKRILTLLLAGAFSLILSAQAQTRILPLGDSVTSGFSPYSSYRYWLWNELVNDGYSVDFVGTQTGVADGPPGNPNFDQDNEGHPGWTTQDALDNISSIIAATGPDVVLLDLGANDMEQGFAMRTTVANLKTLIADFRAANPNVIILLAEPTPYRGPGGARMAGLATVVYDIAVAENRKSSRVIAVNLFSGFSVARDTYDGVHPNATGEQLIAARFLRNLRRILP